MTLDALQKAAETLKGALPYIRGESGAEITPKQRDALCLSANALPALLDVVRAALHEHGGDQDEPECPICAALRALAASGEGKP